jgi:predicted lysophospholipase L1 biosynthesis ABC-type transport system permease subunit
MYGRVEVVGQGYPRSRPTRTIVGVAGDSEIVRTRGRHGEEYRPIVRDDYGRVALLVRSRTDPGRLIETLRRSATAPDSRILPSVLLLARQYDRALEGPRLTSTIAGATAMLVLTLACLGIFGVVSYGVKVRTKEIGIRRALGAGAREVVVVLLRQLLWPVGLAGVIGAAAGVLVSRVLSGDPFYLAAGDVTSSVSALAVFVIATCLAAIVPAWRAMRADPVRALRHE